MNSINILLVDHCKSMPCSPRIPKERRRRRLSDMAAVIRDIRHFCKKKDRWVGRILRNVERLDLETRIIYFSLKVYINAGRNDKVLLKRRKMFYNCFDEDYGRL